LNPDKDLVQNSPRSGSKNGAHRHLYDFNYEDSELASHAAAHQIGRGNGNNGRNEGFIYRYKIVIDHVYDYPFEQTRILPPPP